MQLPFTVTWVKMMLHNYTHRRKRHPSLAIVQGTVWYRKQSHCCWSSHGHANLAGKCVAAPAPCTFKLATSQALAAVVCWLNLPKKCSPSCQGTGIVCSLAQCNTAQACVATKDLVAYHASKHTPHCDGERVDEMHCDNIDHVACRVGLSP